MIITLLTWNIHAAVGRDGQCNPKRVWQLIDAMNADLIGLQEVDLASLSTDPFLRFAHNAGYDTHFVATRSGYHPDSRFGNLILSRLPLTNKDFLDISVTNREPRAVATANITINQRTMQIGVTHLGLKSRERRIQAELIHHLSLTGASDRILLGDFNEWRPGRSSLGALHRSHTRLPSPRSFPAHRPLFRLDGIWLAGRISPFSITASTHPLARIASDHLPILARVRIE